MITPEEIKASSRHLRGDLVEELASQDPAFGHDSIVLLKFHGIYQQDDRDVRRARTQKKLPLDYSCMVRAAVPAGLLQADQWLALDRVAEMADSTLRITTRQGVQFHTVVKDSLKPLIGALNRELITTLAACGDVVRNVMACPAPLPDGRRAVLDPAVDTLVKRFRPRTPAYYEVWADGERAVTAQAPVADGPVEPLYGDLYLPRKFKIGLAWPGDNCIDVYTQDLGVVPILSKGTSGDLTGWMLFVGGGLGMSHAREEDTYPRLASPLGWVSPDDLAAVAEAVVVAQRDHGRRDDRHRARLKYLIDERGLAWFRAEVEARFGKGLGDPVELPAWEGADEHLGWFPTDTGDWALGIPVASGRVRDSNQQKLRSGIRAVLQGALAPRVRLTPRQDLVFDGVAPEDRVKVDNILRDHGVVFAEDLTPLSRLAVACPALPTCGQALGEAERVLPQLVDGLEAALAEAGRAGQPLRLNMTGCPNGCARPYTAEIGIVGRTKRNYDIYIGGSVGGERLAERLRADVPLDQVPALLQPLFARFERQAHTGEGFGDFCHRVGTATLETMLPAPTSRRNRPGAEAD